jgi:hypothetical protein
MLARIAHALRGELARSTRHRIVCDLPRFSGALARSSRPRVRVGWAVRHRYCLFFGRTRPVRYEEHSDGCNQESREDIEECFVNVETVVLGILP